ncbi:sarcolemmal membrane-associated protein-like isoform X2 [Asterias rubens]|uniref:sarcolemmal membrane-associated protein-like isoform X2 n=1 Tax=Asterias rubens TaxID=7604 RepID=UPI0014550BC1|nr:sarcolemmal membrane-associated protein-like isoform X2 [Asterias rubens]
MTAIAVFTCHSSSHPFQERKIPLKEPVKIGRSVAKARPTVENGIFDCKVLSRNHALIWYDQDTLKFYLQDTKSSNGTFINNQRLSRGAEESPAHELNSCDIIQFGVDVMENSRRGVVTHGCIVSQLTLYNPDGTEAIRSTPAPSLTYNATSPTSNNVPSQDLYQLSHYLKEALHREQMLEQKLAGLQRLLTSTQEASENSWQALIDEDRLLSRLEVLESQLRAYSKANSEESIRKELVALQEDKHNYESTAKESLKTALEEKLEACRKLSDMERMLSNSEDECAHSKEEVERLQEEQQTLITKHSEVVAELKEVAEKLVEAEKLHADEVERLTIEKTELERKVDIASREEIALATRIEEMQAECDFAREQLMAVKLRYEEAQEQLSHYVKEKENPEEKEGLAKDKNRKIIQENEDDSRQISNKDETDSSDTKDNTIENNSKSLKEDDESLEKDLKEETDEDVKVNGDATPKDVSPTEHNRLPGQRSLEEELEEHRGQLVESENRLRESQDQVNSLQLQLKQAQLEAIENIAKANAIQEKLQDAEKTMEEAINSATANLRERIAEMEASERSKASPVIETLHEPIFAKSEERVLTAAAPDARNNLLNTMLPEQLADLHNHIGEESDFPCGSSDTSLSETLHEDSSASFDDRLEDALHLSAKEIETLKEKLKESQIKQQSYEEQLDKLRGDLKEMQVRHEVLTEKNEELKERLMESQDEAREAVDRVDDLQEQLDRAENSAKEVNDQILELRDQLMEEQHTAKASVADATQAKQQLNKEQEALKRQGSLLEQIQKQLTTVEAKSLQTETQIEEYTDEIKHLKEELEKERQERLRLEKESKGAQQTQRKSKEVEAQKQGAVQAPPKTGQINSASSKENLVLQSECSDLKVKLKDTEAKLTLTRKESGKLGQDTNKLQILLKQAEAQRNKLTEDEFRWKKETKEMTKELERKKQLLSAAEEDRHVLTERVRVAEEDKLRLQRELKQTPTSQETGVAAAHSMSQMKYVPIIVILIAIIAAVVQFFVAMSSSV